MNEKEQRELREVLPYRGWWTVQDLADYLNLPAATVMQKLSDWGIRVRSFSRMYRHKMVQLEDLGKEEGAGSSE
jgi:hypothetical protein